MISVVDATPEHCEYVAEHMRDVDIEEALVFAQKYPWAAVRECYMGGTHKWAVVVDGEPVLMFGVSPSYAHPEGPYSRAAMPWLFGTTNWNLARRSLLRSMPEYLFTAFGAYDVLYNWISTENYGTIRWLEWLGFTVYEPDRRGYFGMNARFFQMWGDEYVLRGDGRRKSGT